MSIADNGSICIGIEIIQTGKMVGMISFFMRTS